MLVINRSRTSHESNFYTLEAMAVILLKIESDLVFKPVDIPRPAHSNCGGPTRSARL